MSIDNTYYGQVVGLNDDDETQEPERPRGFRRFFGHSRKEPVRSHAVTVQAAPSQPRKISIWLVKLPVRDASDRHIRDQMIAAAGTILVGLAQTGPVKLYVSDNKRAVRSGRLLADQLLVSAQAAIWLAVGEGSQSSWEDILPMLTRLPSENTVILAYGEVIDRILAGTGRPETIPPGGVTLCHIELPR